MNNREYLEKYLDKDKLEEGLKKLESGIPVQYIVGNVDFYGNIINVNKNVLIPRFETEDLVYKTINYIDKYFNKKIDILEIGTGSGAISITLKKKINANITACDISLKALEVAKQNSIINNTDISFVESDLFANIEGKFDVIISNPPYIDRDELIEDIVKNNEPHLALYADDHGLYFYKEIIKNSKKYLNDKSILAFEIGYKQGDDLLKYSKKYYNEKNIIIEKDLYGKDRFLFILNI